MSLGPALARELAAAAGEAGFEEHPAREVDGVAIGATLRPADGEALASTLGALDRAELGAVIRGAGSRLALGNPPRGVAVFLSTERLHGVDVFDAEEGVCHVLAGTPLAAVRAEVEARGWQLPLDPPEPDASVGGTLASAAVGPRSAGFGPPRDAVLGLEVALASGERTRCGGRVVKNVTGYDLNKLYTGSLGSLGVIEAAWLRLRPLPQAARVFEAHLAGLEAALDAGLAAARRSSARATALLTEARREAEVRLVVELAGPEAAVERDVRWLEQRFAATPADGALDELRSLQRSPAGDGSLRFRIAALPSRLGAALAELTGRVLVYPGLGLVYASDGGAGVAQGFRAASAAAREGGGSWLLEAGPLAAKQGRDVFGEESDALPLARALKDRFDPNRILNPGRFQGFL